MRNMGKDQRRKPRQARERTAEARISYQARPGVAEVTQVRLCDVSEGGCGIVAPVELKPGSLVSISGDVGVVGIGRDSRLRAKVVWTAPNAGGGWRCGLAFDEAMPGHGGGGAEVEGGVDEVDLYEVLQVSPKADADTIQRVHRILAQRFHPDNADTGNPEMFRRVMDAWRVLGDAEKRAAYDARHSKVRARRWRIFDQAAAATGVAAEKRKRQGILNLLYVKRMQTPESPAMSLTELEDLLGCPREHLEFPLWYLREQGWVARSDNARFAITAKGVDEAEKIEASSDAPQLFLPMPEGEPEAAA